MAFAFHRRRRKIFSEAAGLLAALFLFAALAVPIFRDYFTRPNARSYSFGGDALVLYYNTAFHARYGEGTWLHGTNYPDGEYIYLTDAQGAVSYLLQGLRRLGWDVSAYAVGIVHSLNLYLLFAAVGVVLGLLWGLRCRWLTAVLFAPLIVLLSPQLVRMGGHFGLAYPVAIPLAMAWFVRKYRLRRWEGWDVLFAGAALFFTYNNPYVGFDMLLLLCGAGGLTLLWKRFRRAYWVPGWGAVLMGLGCLLWVFADFQRNDPVNDRINPQWGFFFYQARLEGLLFPPGSLLYDWLSCLGVRLPEDLNFETLLNIGAVSAIGLLAAVLWLPWQKKYRPNEAYLLLLGASGLLFLLAANTSLLPISPSWIEDHLDELLMFKAAARLAWPLYFALTLAAVWSLDALLRALCPAWLSILFLFAAAALWNAEINQYIAPRFRQVFHTNFLSREQEGEIWAVLNDHRIQPSEFQAILAIPRYAAWSDKVWPHLPFEAHFWSVRLSLATGLPIINPTLSRIGTQHVMERVQLFAHPLVERSLLPKLKPDKDILLLVASEEQPLSTGEKYLQSLAIPLAETPRYRLYRLRVSDMVRSAAIEEAQQRYRQGYRSAPAFYLSFDQTPSDIAFYGPGAYRTTPQEDSIGTFRSPYERDTTVVFAAWNYADAGRWNPGFWRLIVRDLEGREIRREEIESRKSPDVQGNYWFRVEKEVHLPRHATLSVIAFGEKAMYIDEVMVWPKGDMPLVVHPEEEGFLFGNFWVRKPREVLDADTTSSSANPMR